MKSPRVLFWYRKDLRIQDNNALIKTLSISKAITSLYIFDRNYPLDFNAKSRAWFLSNSLKELSKTWEGLGSRLIIDEGEPINLIPEIAKIINAKFVAWNKGLEPYEIKRDLQIKNILNELNINVIDCMDHLLIHPNSVSTGDGNPYKVFGPFYKNLESKLTYADVQTEVITKIKLLDLKQETLENTRIKLSNKKLEKFINEINFAGQKMCPCKPGEAAANNLLENFLKSHKINDYENSRDFPSQDGTSYLSGSLRFGTISIRKIWNKSTNLEIENKKHFLSIRTWQKELFWREFYHHCLFHFPELESGPYRQKWKEFPWQNKPEWFNRWSNGDTGIPIIDAAMRQLNQSGWMHNRCRMIVASFLVKDLICNWQMGEKKFLELLVDGDLAANNGGWQWSASSGMDPKPLRIFNPYTQTKKFDPLCEYIKFWVPELSKIPNSQIINGDITSIESISYPKPLINHNIQQRFFKSLYAEI